MEKYPGKRVNSRGIVEWIVPRPAGRLLGAHNRGSGRSHFPAQVGGSAPGSGYPGAWNKNILAAGEPPLSPLPEPGHRLPEPLLNKVLRIILKRLPRARDIGERVPDVARTRRLVDGVALCAGDLHKDRCKVVQVDPVAICNVEGPRGTALHRPDVRLDHVGDEGEVAGLLPVAVDDRGP